MSTFNELDITCQACGEEFKGIVWNAIHAAQDPELKEVLFGGELNLLMCPKCSHVQYQESFVLYQDPSAELIAYIHPPSQQNDENFLRAAMKANFKEAQKVYPPKDRKYYDPILIFGLENFVEMMKVEHTRAAQSQIAEAICKEKEIPYVLLRPSEARQLGTVRVIPGARGQNAEIVRGIKELLAANPALDLYAKL